MNRLYLELAVALVLVVGFFFYRHSLIVDGEQKIEMADRRAAEAQQAAIAKQQAQDALQFKAAQEAHQRELQALLTAPPLPVVRVCEPAHPGAVPAAQTRPGHLNPAPGVLSGDAAVHPDLTGALELLARRADRLAADARFQQAVIQ